MGAGDPDATDDIWKRIPCELGVSLSKGRSSLSIKTCPIARCYYIHRNQTQGVQPSAESENKVVITVIHTLDAANPSGRGGFSSRITLHSYLKT